MQQRRNLNDQVSHNRVARYFTMSSVAAVHPSVCPLDCPDTCSLDVTVKANEIIKVRGSKANAYTDAAICKKVGRYYPEMIHGMLRLTTPLVRMGPRGSNHFAEISWTEAIDLIHYGITNAINRYGPQSVLPFNYAGPHGELAGASMDRRFFYKLGASLLNRGPLCGGVRGSAYTSLFGTVPGMPPEQAVHSDLIVIWGNNVTVSNLHFARVVKTARENGAEVVTVDPKRTKIAQQSNLHLQIMPGTDVVFAMAMAAEIERRGLVDDDFVNTWTTGYNQYMEQARNYTVDDVENICKLSKEQFAEFADLYAGASNVAVSVGNGIERGHSGGSGLRAAMALQVLTGNHGRLGAGVIAKPGSGAPKTPDRLQRPDLIPQGTRTFNIVDVPDLMLDPTLDPPIKAVMIYNHNPVAVHPNQRNVIEALSDEDVFIAGADIVMTDSMSYCDVILPAASHFEYDDVYGAYGQNYIQRAEPVIPCVGESVPNTEIFRRLAAKFEFDDPIFLETDAQLMDAAMDASSPVLNGIRPSEIPTDRAIEIKAANASDPILCKNVFPNTSSGKIELYSVHLESQFGFGVPRYRHVRRDFPFMLISPASSKRTNATFGGCKDSKDTEIVEMNPKDADARSLCDGDLLTVWNGQGKVTLKLSVTDATRPGVLYSPKGAWLDTSDTGLTVNCLIPSHIRTDIEDGACYNETFVDVERAPDLAQ